MTSLEGHKPKGGGLLPRIGTKKRRNTHEHSHKKGETKTVEVEEKNNL